MRTCTIDWCEGYTVWQWYCRIHYSRNRNRWSPYIIKQRKWQKRTIHYLYEWYIELKQRCLNIKNRYYKNYWWRGISVCERWLWIDWFTNFLLDMWDRPDWYTLDRINVNWPYSPENCRWASRHQQCWNKTNNNKCVGVSWQKNTLKRQSHLMVNNVYKYLWSYDNYEDAVKARKNAEIKYNIIL